MARRDHRGGAVAGVCPSPWRESVSRHASAQAVVLACRWPAVERGVRANTSHLVNTRPCVRLDGLLANLESKLPSVQASVQPFELVAPKGHVAGGGKRARRSARRPLPSRGPRGVARQVAGRLARRVAGQPEARGKPGRAKTGLWSGTGDGWYQRPYHQPRSSPRAPLGPQR
jgi:hypothetical protein